MSNVSGILTASDISEVTTDKLHTLGTEAVTVDGRKFRYAKAGAAALAAGKLAVAADPVATVVNVAATAVAAVGDRQVRLTAGAAVAANAYADGILQVNDADGEGHTYRIEGNTAGTAVIVRLADPLHTALALTSEVSLYKNEFDSIVISATDQADLAVGVANVVIPAGSYGWVQTYGMAAVLADEAVTRGQTLTIGTGVAGAVEAADLIGEQTVGVAAQALIDTEYSPVFLTIG